MMKGLFLAFAFLVLPALARAQTTADLNTATLQWQWAQGTGGVPTEFHFKCGNASKVYTKLTIVPGATMRVVNVKDVIGGTGNWYCAVSAINAIAESPDSNEVFFSAGAGPSGPNSLVLVP